ncbi:hypothetical protein ACFVIY_17915 [Streptomyces sp. NPDC127166]|uniref:hypothetical protein n=1 Tax=Streptomyces sp. NPDC127166 TaxID=3345380 RepID=UPI003642D3FA
MIEPTFEYRDSDGARLAIDHVNASTYYGNEPVVALLTEHRDGDDVPVVYVPLDRIEEVIAGIRDAARTAAARQTTGQDDTTPPPAVNPACTNCNGVNGQQALERLRRAATQWRTAHDEGDLGVAWDEAAVTVLALIDNPNVTWADLGFTRPAITGHAVVAPAVGQPAEAHDTDEARPPHSTWRVEGHDVDRWLPLGLAEEDRQTAVARRSDWDLRLPDTPTRIVRETTTWTVEDQR